VALAVSMPLAAPAAEAFDAICSPERWWTPLVERFGSGFVLRFDGMDEEMEFRVDSARAPSSLQWTCVRHSGAPVWYGSVLVFELVDEGDSCSLAFRHSGVPRELVEPGWRRFLGSLADYVATGAGRPFRAAS
jgi:Activator of Hsp90 ATPase homolog 1-like protein